MENMLLISVGAGVLFLVVVCAAVFFFLKWYREQTVLSRQSGSQNVSQRQLSEATFQITPQLLESTDLNKIFQDARVGDVMTREVISIREDAPFSDVPKKFKEFHIRHLPVVDAQNKLVGLVTQRQMYKIKSPRRLLDGEWYYDEEMLNSVILKHAMAREVFALNPESSLRKALIKMIYSNYGSIPVVRYDNTLCGIITRRDVLKVIARIYKDQA